MIVEAKRRPPHVALPKRLCGYLESTVLAEAVDFNALVCERCREAGAISMQPTAQGVEFHCSHCDDRFATTTIRQFLAFWNPIIGRMDALLAANGLAPGSDCPAC